MLLSQSIKKLLWNDQGLTDLNLVRVIQLVTVRFEDLHVVVCIAIELFRDLRKSIAGLNRVMLSTTAVTGTAARTCAPGGRLLRHRETRIDSDVGGQIGVARVYLLDSIPDLILDLLIRRSPLNEQLPIFDMYVLQ